MKDDITSLWARRRELIAEVAQLESQLSSSRGRMAPEEREVLLTTAATLNAEMRRIRVLLGLERPRT